MPEVQNILVVLYIALICFVCINLVLGVILWGSSREVIYKKIIIYWASSITFFAIQFFFPHSEFQVSMAYGSVFISMIAVHYFVSEILSSKFYFWQFACIHVVGLVASLYLNIQGYGFTQSTLPMCLTASLPVALSIKQIFLGQNTTIMQKIMGFILSLWFIHVYTFAFFRMAPGAELTGWMITYTLYDMMAIFLPALALEKTFKLETDRLENKVKQRTEDLNHALKDKEHLLKILLHDITNPLSVMKNYLHLMDRSEDKRDVYLAKVKKSQDIVEGIVEKVRNLELSPNNHSASDIRIQDCIEEMTFVLENNLKAKNIRLEIIDLMTNPNVRIRANQFSLTHNVLSNFINNAIKFSFNDSVIKIIMIESNNRLILKIQDYGQGMSQMTIARLHNNEQITSSIGTGGELGTGHGINIAKKIITSFGATFNIESISKDDNELGHGTTVSINFPISSIS